MSVGIEVRKQQRISSVTGDVTVDGGTILLRVETERDGPIDLSLPTADLEHFVTLLLMLGGKAAVNGRFAAFEETFQARPLPLHGVSLGVEEDDRGVLTVEVGQLSWLFRCHAAPWWKWDVRSSC